MGTTNIPIRVQRKRTKGWRMPKNTKCVNRGTKWGNPLRVFSEGKFGDAIYIKNPYSPKTSWEFLMWGDLAKCLEVYKALLHQDYDYLNTIYDETMGAYFIDWLGEYCDIFEKLDFSELKGKNLACFCNLDKMCHADILLELANK